MRRLQKKCSAEVPGRAIPIALEHQGSAWKPPGFCGSVTYLLAIGPEERVYLLSGSEVLRYTREIEYGFFLLLPTYWTPVARQSYRYHRVKKISTDKQLSETESEPGIGKNAPATGCPGRHLKSCGLWKKSCKTASAFPPLLAEGRSP